MSAPAKRSLLLAAACLLLATGPAFAKDSPGKDSRFSLPHDGRVRTYLVHLPASYNKEKARPVVLVFHGGGGQAEKMASMTGFSRKADREGFIADYPNGSGYWQNRFLTWNSGNCCAWAYENRIDDVGFIRALIGQRRKDYAVDERRGFATGISNGGMMSYRLACGLTPAAGVKTLVFSPHEEYLLRPCSGISSTDGGLSPHPS